MPYKSMLLDSKKLIFTRLLIPALLAILVAVPAAGCEEPGIHYYNARVPIVYKDLENIGSLHIELEFDDRLVMPQGVQEAGRGGMFTYGMESTSKMVIGIARVSLNGSGTLAYVTFKVNGDAQLPTDLVLSNVSATDALTGKKVDVTWAPGSINPVDKTVISPEVSRLP
jgi:hypothetical protein